MGKEMLVLQTKIGVMVERSVLWVTIFLLQAVKVGKHYIKEFVTVK